MPTTGGIRLLVAAGLVTRRSCDTAFADDTSWPVGVDQSPIMDQLQALITTGYSSPSDFSSASACLALSGQRGVRRTALAPAAHAR